MLLRARLVRTHCVVRGNARALTRTLQAHVTHLQSRARTDTRAQLWRRARTHTDSGERFAPWRGGHECAQTRFTPARAKISTGARTHRHVRTGTCTQRTRERPEGHAQPAHSCSHPKASTHAPQSTRHTSSGHMHVTCRLARTRTRTRQERPYPCAHAPSLPSQRRPKPARPATAGPQGAPRSAGPGRPGRSGGSRAAATARKPLPPPFGPPPP